MKDFANPFDEFPMRAKPWFRLQREETSYIIYNAYRMHFLKSEDVQRFVRLHRLQQVTYWAFPLLAYPAVNYAVWQQRHRFPRFNHRTGVLWTLGGTAALWWAFSKLSPFRRSYDAEKEKVLNYLDANMSMAMLHFNNMLPRYWTENWVNGFTAQLYRRRHSWFTGILFPYEGVTSTILSEDEYPLQTEASY